MRNPYRISKKFFSKEYGDITDEIDTMYLEYVEQIGGIDNFTEDDADTLKITFFCRYLEYRNRFVNYIDN